MLEWLFGKKKEEPKEEKPKRPKKSRAEEQSEDKWKYEFLVQFLNSPLWKVSILDFVDQKCVIFDSEEQNKFEYTVVHNQFKELIGVLFDGMMSEVGLDDDKLVELLEKGFESKQKKLFNQLLLCDDFLKFKNLMVNRNKALEKQAILAMQGGSQVRRTSKLEMQRDIVHESMRAEQERLKKIEQEEEEILRKVLEMSKIEAEERSEINRLADKTEQYEDARRDSGLDQQRRREEEQKERQEQQKLRQKEQKQRQIRESEREKEQEEEQRMRMKEEEAKESQKKRRIEQKKQEMKAKLAGKNNSKLDPISNQAKVSDLPPLRGQPKKEEAASIAEEEPDFQSPVKVQEPLEEKAEEKSPQKAESQEERKKRLMEQREKIRKKKEEERKRMLEEQQPAKGVQSIVLQDEGIHDSTYPMEKEAEEKVSNEEIERRKEIMRKIKNRIVDDF